MYMEYKFNMWGKNGVPKAVRLCSETQRDAQQKNTKITVFAF